MAREIGIEELANKAMQVLAEYLDTPKELRDIEMTRAARVASSVLSTWGTLRQTENSMEALRVMVARELSGEKGDSFRRFLLNGGGNARQLTGER